MRSMIIIFLGAVLCMSLSQAINCNCELETQDYLRHILNNDLRLVNRHHSHYPYLRYGPEAIKITKTGTSGTVSKTVSTLNNGHIHGLPGISCHSSLRDSLIVEKELVGNLNNLQGLNHLHQLGDLRGELHHLRDRHVLDQHLGLVRPGFSAAAYEKVIAVPESERFGFHHRRPNLVDIEYIRSVVPNNRIVDLEVLRREPVYNGLPIYRNSLRSGELTIKEKIKQPSIALKERETVYLGGEQQRSQRVASIRGDALARKLELGC